MALYQYQCDACSAIAEEWHPMTAAPDFGAVATTLQKCSCGGRFRRVATASVAVRVPRTSFPVLQYRHLKGCREYNGHPIIESKQHLAEVCAMNDLRVERDAGVDI